MSRTPSQGWSSSPGGGLTRSRAVAVAVAVVLVVAVAVVVDAMCKYVWVLLATHSLMTGPLTSFFH
jgi:hypothetical protein